MTIIIAFMNRLYINIISNKELNNDTNNDINQLIIKIV